MPDLAKTIPDSVTDDVQSILYKMAIRPRVNQKELLYHCFITRNSTIPCVNLAHLPIHAKNILSICDSMKLPLEYYINELDEWDLDRVNRQPIAKHIKDLKQRRIEQIWLKSYPPMKPLVLEFDPKIRPPASIRHLYKFKPSR